MIIVISIALAAAWFFIIRSDIREKRRIRAQLDAMIPELKDKLIDSCREAEHLSLTCSLLIMLGYPAKVTRKAARARNTAIRELRKITKTLRLPLEYEPRRARFREVADLLKGFGDPVTSEGEKSLDIDGEVFWSRPVIIAPEEK